MILCSQRTEILAHKSLYEKDAPIISDAKYDELVKDFRNKEKVLIIHDIDPDGLLSAVILGKFYDEIADLEELHIPIEYVRAIRYEDPPYELMDENSVVFIVDFNYDKEQVKKIAGMSKRVVTLDHHKTALEELAGLDLPNVQTKIEIDKAACRVVWEYCFPYMDSPWQVDYVEDMDLWKWQQPHSKEINSYLSTIDTTVPEWEALLQSPLGDVKEKGFAVWQYKRKTMNILEKFKMLMKIGDYWVPAINCSDPSIVSYLGNRLAHNVPFGATFYLQGNGKWKFSLRSVMGEGLPGVDVSEVAKQFGGGGHKEAAGFKIDSLFESKKIEYVKNS